MSDSKRKSKRRGPLRWLLDLVDDRTSARVYAEARSKGHTMHRKPGTRTLIGHDPRWSERRLQMLNNPDGESETPGRGVEMAGPS
jgi:hypothetical protein